MFHMEVEGRFQEAAKNVIIW